MGKTSAEYQKAYRERRKIYDNKFLEKERLRATTNRILTKELSTKEQDIVRSRNKIYSQRYRDKKKLARSRIDPKTEQINNHEQSIADSSSMDVSMTPSTSSESDERFIRSSNKQRQCIFVKLPFPSRSKIRKRRSKALKKACVQIQNLKKTVNDLKRNNERVRKRFDRLKIKRQQGHELSAATESDSRTPETVNPLLTPSSKTKRDLKLLGLTRREAPKKIVKKLDMSNAMVDEVKQACNVQKSQKERRVVMNVVCGKIMKKYKCLETLRRETGMCRNSLRARTSKSIQIQRRKRLALQIEELKRHVVQFMERDDVSINMPGKNDSKTHDGEKRQIRILNDYIGNVYDKYAAENPEKKISKSVFGRCRPKNILLTRLISRNTCLCSKHQNFAMKLKCLRSLGLNVSPNPESVSKTLSKNDMNDLLMQIDEHQNIKYDEWRRVTCEDGKKRMKIITVSVDRAKFVDTISKEYDEFLAHVDRVRAQYAAVRELKSNLPKDHVAIQMDFAENYTCGNMDEIQSAYWNSSAVTLHPVVLYHTDAENGSLQHKSIIYISDVGNHNTSAVFTILKMLVPEIMSILPGTEMIHYWTDSPSSQYTNRFIFDIVLRHKELFGVAGRWNYFEAGHGKGPCDGLGGVAKRQAGEACKQGKVNIQDASDFFKWASGQQKHIEYRYYTNEEYQSSSKELNEINAMAIPGTMKLHAIFVVDKQLYTAFTSCYCKQCIDGDPCSHWTAVHAKQDKGATNAEARIVEKRPIPKINTYVLAKYDEKVYIGKVLEVDNGEKDARISFMEESKGKSAIPLFKWPSRDDELWVDFDSIICNAQDPIPYGKTKRQFRLHESEYAYFDNM